MSLAPVEQEWDDVSPVEVHLGSCVNMGPPDTLFKRVRIVILYLARNDIIDDVHTVS